MYANVMKSLNKEAFAGIDYGHILLGLGLAGAIGYTGLPAGLKNTLNTDVVGGLDVGHIALGLGALSTLGIGYYRR